MTLFTKHALMDIDYDDMDLGTSEWGSLGKPSERRKRRKRSTHDMYEPASTTSKWQKLADFDTAPIELVVKQLGESFHHLFQSLLGSFLKKDDIESQYLNMTAVIARMQFPWDQIRAWVRAIEGIWFPLMRHTPTTGGESSLPKVAGATELNALIVALPTQAQAIIDKYQKATQTPMRPDLQPYLQTPRIL